MTSRTATATAMAFRDQRRRPLVLILLVLFPAYVITKAVADTKATPRMIELPGGAWIATTMRSLHGPEMAKISVAFGAALAGLFVMHSALQGDRRLVLAGYRAGEAVAARLVVLAAAIALVVAVSVGVSAAFFTPAQWAPFLAALVLAGLIYGELGALAGALLEKLPATYLILFLVMSDLGVVQSPMFHGAPVGLAFLLPGYAPTQVMLSGAFGHSFTAGGQLLLAVGWLAVLSAGAYLLLRRAIVAHGARDPLRSSRRWAR
jgi:hypothetical protein